MQRTFRVPVYTRQGSVGTFESEGTRWEVSVHARHGSTIAKIIIATTIVTTVIIILTMISPADMTLDMPDEGTC